MEFSALLLSVSTLIGMGMSLGCSSEPVHREAKSKGPTGRNLSSNSTSGFSIGSNDLVDGGQVPAAYVFNGMGCTGKNLSPEIHWSNPPAGTKSFALTVYDSKAPTGSGFWHWMVIDIPSTVSSILPSTSGANVGKVVVNDFGLVSYDGPCPPLGWTDPYTFTIYALNTDKLENLGLQEGASNAVVRFFLQGGGSIIGKTSFTVNYTHQ